MKGIEVCRDRNREVDGEKRTPGEKVRNEVHDACAVVRGPA